MGSVYAAERIATHQQYAIKFLREDHLDNESSLARFDREIQALRAIRHPHVVGVFDAFAPKPGEPGRPWVVMEMLEGEGLDRLLRRRRSVSPSLAVSIMLHVLDGLAAVHARGIVHRDLGPSNIFLVPQPGGSYLAKVLDFGLSRLTESSGEERANITQQGTLMGKPAYVAPEMFHHIQPDARGDLYACGVMLFRMITGRLPYRELQAAALWAERYEERTHPPVRPKMSVHVPDLPEPLEACVAKAMQLDPQRRFQSAEEMQAVLLEIEQRVLPRQPPAPFPVRPLSEGPTAPTTEPVSPVRTTPPPDPRRRWRLYAGIAGICAVAALGLAFALTRGEPEPSGSGRPAAGAADAPYVALGVPSATEAGAAGDVGAAPTPAPDAGVGVKVAGDVPETVDGPVADATTATAPDAGDVGPTVHFAFQEVPAGATITVDGLAVDPAVGIDLPQADRTVDVVVTPVQGGLRPYRVSVSTRDDRVIRPRFRRGATRDAGPTVIHGQQGTTFVLDLGGQR